MKKIIYIYILMFFACDPGWLGLEEEIGIYSYHDGLALAWESYFDGNNYDIAIAYVNSTINETEDEEYYNSAYTSLGWLYLFKSNIFAGNNSDSLTYYRDSAFQQLSYIENEELAIIEYDTGCYYNFCCSDCFAKDRQLGLLYTQIENYFVSSSEQRDNIDIQTLINELASFVLENPQYNFMDGKPTGDNGQILDLSIDNVKIYLAHVYFRMGQFIDSCYVLSSLDGYKDLCIDLECSIDWDNTNLEDLLDCINNIQPLF